MPRRSGGACQNKKASQESQSQQSRQQALSAPGPLFLYGKGTVVASRISQVELSAPKGRQNQPDQVLGDRLLLGRTLAIHLAWEAASVTSTVSSIGFQYNFECSPLTIA
jgi:hypothetical protein